MPLLLNIDTATEHASVCISKGGNIVGIAESAEQKNHASFLQPAIAQLLAQHHLSLTAFDAIAVTSGPGSYTGLRVGLASAKGICYALNKPLILVNTLKVMAQAIITYHHSKQINISPDTLLCPMIDARRMEVFTAVYGQDMAEKQAPHALIIDELSLQELYGQHPVIVSGSGHQKLKAIVTNSRLSYLDIRHNASDLALLALGAYQSQSFSDLAYSEPLYVKEFFDPSRPGADKNKKHS